MKALVCVSLVVFGSMLTAQEDLFKPAPALKKLERVAGNWTFSGTSAEEDGSQARWTGASSSRWILGGHFLEEDLRVDIENGPRLVFRSLYGWDRERKKFALHGVSSMGSAAPADMYLLDDDTIVTVSTRLENGVPVVERSISRYSGDTVSFHIESARGGGPFKTTVEGKGKKSTEGYRISGKDAESALLPIPGEMERLAGMRGHYTLKGKVVPFPGMPAMDISGRETIAPLFGGLVHSHHVRGDAAPGQPRYEAWLYIFWDADNDCYVQFYADSMGFTGRQECRFANDRELVAIGAGLQYGQPGAERTVVRLGEGGVLKEAYTDRFVSTAKAIRNFAGTYTKVTSTDL